MEFLPIQDPGWKSGLEWGLKPLPNHPPVLVRGWQRPGPASGAEVIFKKSSFWIKCSTSKRNEKWINNELQRKLEQYFVNNEGGRLGVDIGLSQYYMWKKRLLKQFHWIACKTESEKKQKIKIKVNKLKKTEFDI